MSKQSKRPNRRNRLGRARIRQTDHGLKVSIFTSPEVIGGEVTLSSELRLVRSALLYADTVELVSPAAAMLETFSPLSLAGESDTSALLSQLDDATLARLGLDGDPDQVRQVFQVLPQILAMPEKARRELLASDVEAELLAGLSEAKKAMSIVGDMAAGLLSRSGAAELEGALASGAFRVESSGYSFESATRDQLQWFTSRLLSALEDPTATLLLDERTVQHLQGIDTNQPAAATLDRALRASVGSGLIELLPTFPEASMSDVLELREDLSDGRTRYRGAVRRLGDSLASSAFDQTLPSELNELWHDEVKPALRDMQGTVTASKLGRGVAARLVGDYKSLVTGGTFLVAIENLTALTPTGTGAAALGANIAWQAIAEALRTRSEVRKHELVYLLDVHRGLGGKRI